MQNAFYNTINETPIQKEASDKRAIAQQDFILSIFERDKRVGLTPEWVWDFYYKRKPPVTSIRRAFSNLQAQGLIEKTGEMRPGIYGKPVHIWRFRNPDSNQLRLAV